MEIRLAVKNDVDQIVELWKYMMTYHQRINEHFAKSRNGHEKFRLFLKRQIGSGSAVVMIAREQDEIIGFCLGLIMEYPPVFSQRKKGHINDMVVKEEFQGQGVGGNLLEKTLYWFKQVGIENIELDVVTGNESAEKFYQKHGFRVIIHRLLKKL